MDLGVPGLCRVRYFDGQKIRFKGGVAGWQIDFIEKKRLFHFFPGTYVLSLGFYSCNLSCPWCINWEITKTAPKNAVFWDIDKIRYIAEYYNVSGISFAHSSPEIYAEYIIDISKKIKKTSNLYITLSTAGYLTLDILSEFANIVDAFVVDLKLPSQLAKIVGANEKYAQLIWDKLRLILRKKKHLEITYLPIPRINDDEKYLIRIIKKLVNLGLNDVPFHLLRFHPEYRCRSFPPIKKKKLIYLANKAKQYGMKFVYVADFPFTEFENTYCPRCGFPLIERVSSIPIRIGVNGNTMKCPNCNFNLLNVIKFR